MKRKGLKTKIIIACILIVVVPGILYYNFYKLLGLIILIVIGAAVFLAIKRKHRKC